MITFSIILAVFDCSSDIDCNNKGICNSGVCDCNPGWDEELDCTGNNPVKVEYDIILMVCQSKCIFSSIYMQRRQSLQWPGDLQNCPKPKSLWLWWSMGGIPRLH